MAASFNDPSKGRGYVGRAVLKHGPLELDLDRYCLSVSGRAILASVFQIRLLEQLMRNPERVFTRRELLAAVCGRLADERRPEAIDVHVCRLRQRLGKARTLIETVRFVGYRLRR